MATADTGIFLGNVLGFVVTSALGYFCAAAAELRLKPRLTQQETEDDCDLWLHDCAASSTDGVFTRTKKGVCALAAPDNCSPYFDAKRSRSSFLPGSNRRASRRQTPLALEGRASKETLTSSGMSATDKLDPYASLNVSPGWSFVGCNILAWTSVYIVRVAVHKARARRFRQASRVINAAGGHRDEPSASDTGRGRNMTLGNSTGVANISSNGGDAIGGRSSTRNVPGVEVPQQARMVSETLQPHDPIYSAGHNAAIADIITERKPRASSNAISGVGSSANLRPYSALPPSSPLSAPLCDLSPSRRAMLSPQTPRLPMLEGISGAKMIRSGDIRGSTGLDISIRERNGRRSMPFAAVEDRAQPGAKAAGGRRTNSAFSPSALTAPCPDPVSPPNLRRPNPASSSSGSEVSFSDGASSQVPACFALFLDAPSTTSPTSTTYSACWTVLGEGFTSSTSLHGVSDLESDVASSTRSGRAVMPGTDGPDVWNPAYMKMSSFGILEQPAAGWKEDIMGPRKNWAALSTGSSVGQNARLPEFGAAQTPELDQPPAGLARTRGGIEDQQRTSTCQVPSTEQGPELDVLAHPNRYKVNVEEPKGVSSRELSSRCRERAFDAHAGYDEIGGGAVEKGAASSYQMSSALKGRELQANVRAERYACCAGEGKGPCLHEIAAENTE